MEAKLKMDTALANSDNNIGLLATSMPSVFNGDIPFLTLSVIDKKGENKTVGKLWGTNGELSFEGDMDTSAQVFFDSIIEKNRAALSPPPA